MEVLNFTMQWVHLLIRCQTQKSFKCFYSKTISSSFLRGTAVFVILKHTQIFPADTFLLTSAGTKRVLPRCWLKERHQASVYPFMLGTYFFTVSSFSLSHTPSSLWIYWQRSREVIIGTPIHHIWGEGHLFFGVIRVIGTVAKCECKLIHSILHLKIQPYFKEACARAGKKWNINTTFKTWKETNYWDSTEIVSLQSITSSMKVMVPLTCTTPIWSLCREGWLRTRRPALSLDTNLRTWEKQKEGGVC